ncbi:flagellar motor switch phosphatase FliY [Clostridium pasteurianum DSM 525 = ATCC 6013]|uniref:CheC, phosphatase, inhibitor of MCP methylation / FliN fusion protein n=1 Tax=Clostridium pasteurianum DSM 525 = ATCC 6013 TaxID=1262449 RepID=A0A0H3J1Q7_CLOPA|nr:flagellar motor switch phosphatase FliY [Clostridium pasteurianum]AJA47836.1 flagellar motor switch phosphatase FliY [Clostridium pasteurianum DSM 525 = ATCC 6013]AJA51824.1 flagellar motor switch phosphatase FliY [Clostridium pasteurianum DSM 525 = ATCC 6013]AOZ75127.1 flagellar motor switch protein [Clostridium pasteurianum DSM 525 = ATCC 6013]AOZ78922.1 flagellar motor switch protein [Clostridium pasteurianum]ELP59737.1 flagellar motor switch protein [Clostridium pasteurianum DSM 525 = A
MSDGFLSQEEIDSLLNGGSNSSDDAKAIDKDYDLSDEQKDMLGEIGNISMGSASTALSTIINQQVNITTPVVSITTLKELRTQFQVPNIALDVQYTSGIVGENLLIMKVTDAGVIANLMMGGDGHVSTSELSEIELSAVSEAMNQMIGSAATAMATMLLREVNISPPTSEIINSDTQKLSAGITEDEPIIQVAFRITIGDLVDSSIMQILPIETGKKLTSIMMGVNSEDEPKETETAKEETAASKPVESSNNTPQQPVNNASYEEADRGNIIEEKTIETNQPPVEVQKANFQPLEEVTRYSEPKNIDLILDVPLDISVVLGRSKKSIKEILNLGTGSLIELDRLAEEPVEILVNGKKIAYGEVVVVDENFGVRITSIVSSHDRVKSLGR